MISGNNTFLQDPVSLALFAVHPWWVILVFSSYVCNREESAVQWPRVTGIITDKIQTSLLFCTLYNTELPKLWFVGHRWFVARSLFCKISPSSLFGATILQTSSCVYLGYLLNITPQASAVYVALSSHHPQEERLEDCERRKGAEWFLMLSQLREGEDTK